MERDLSLPFYVGADPEFNVELMGNKKNACNFMHSVLDGADDDGMGFLFDEGNIGWDGCDDTGEMRPKAEKDLGKFVSNIKVLFQKFFTACPIADLTTASVSRPVGGHVHLDWVEGMNYEQVQCFLSSFYAPVLFGETKATVTSRWSNGYGELFDYRDDTKDHGTTIEFRTPSGEWLTTEKIARSTLAYIITVYHEATKHPERLEQFEDILFMQGDARYTALTKLFKSEAKGAPKERNRIIGVMRNALETFELYPKFKDEIDYILSYKKVLADKAKHKYSISKGWGIEPKAPTKLDITSMRRTLAKAKERDLDKVLPLIEVQHSNETGMQVIVDRVKRSIAAHDWKLEFPMYLYGIRKGVDEFVLSSRVGKKEVIVSVNTKGKDPATGPTHKELGMKMIYRNGKPVSIGIPYDVRIAEATKEVLSVIYDVQRGRLRKLFIEA